MDDIKYRTNYINNEMRKIKELTNYAFNIYMIKLISYIGFKYMTATPYSKDLNAYGYDLNNIKTGFKFKRYKDKVPYESYHDITRTINGSEKYHTIHNIFITLTPNTQSLRQLCSNINMTNSICTISLWNSSKVRLIISKVHSIKEQQKFHKKQLILPTHNEKPSNNFKVDKFTKNVLSYYKKYGYVITYQKNFNNNLYYIGNNIHNKKYFGFKSIHANQNKEPISYDHMYEVVLNIKNNPKHIINNIIITNGLFNNSYINTINKKFNDLNLTFDDYIAIHKIHNYLYENDLINRLNAKLDSLQNSSENLLTYNNLNKSTPLLTYTEKLTPKQYCLKYHFTELKFAIKVIRALVHCNYKLSQSTDTNNALDLIGTYIKDPRNIIGITLILYDTPCRVSFSTIYNYIYRIIGNYSHKINRILLITNGTVSRKKCRRIYKKFHNIQLIQDKDISHLKQVLGLLSKLKNNDKLLKKHANTQINNISNLPEAYHPKKNIIKIYIKKLLMNKHIHYNQKIEHKIEALEDIKGHITHIIHILKSYEYNK